MGMSCSAILPSRTIYNNYEESIFKIHNLYNRAFDINSWSIICLHKDDVLSSYDLSNHKFNYSRPCKQLYWKYEEMIAIRNNLGENHIRLLMKITFYS